MVAVQERTLSVWGGQIQPRVKISGSGPPLVFFHGANGLTWDPFLEALSQTSHRLCPGTPRDHAG